MARNDLKLPLEVTKQPVEIFGNIKITSWDIFGYISNDFQDGPPEYEAAVAMPMLRGEKMKKEEDEKSPVVQRKKSLSSNLVWDFSYFFPAETPSWLFSCDVQTHAGVSAASLSVPDALQTQQYLVEKAIWLDFVSFALKELGVLKAFTRHVWVLAILKLLFLFIKQVLAVEP